ncbi:MAG: hypothetical protein ACI9FJ_001872 [Alteromonadaceae bacterium]
MKQEIVTATPCWIAFFQGIIDSTKQKLDHS